VRVFPVCNLLVWHIVNGNTPAPRSWGWIQRVSDPSGLHYYRKSLVCYTVNILNSIAPIYKGQCFMTKTYILILSSSYRAFYERRTVKWRFKRSIQRFLGIWKTVSLLPRLREMFGLSEVRVVVSICPGRHLTFCSMDSCGESYCSVWFPEGQRWRWKCDRTNSWIYLSRRVVRSICI